MTKEPPYDNPSRCVTAPSRMPATGGWAQGSPRGA
jgi:hypothetical protein